MTTGKREVTVGLIQMACGEEPAANLEKALRLVREAAGRGAKIVCLSELFRSRYFCQEEDVRWFELAEPIPGPTTQALSLVAAELGIVLIGSLFEKRLAGVFHNTALVIDADGQLVGRYRKMHIPDDPLYYEKFYFTPGDLGFRSFPTRFANLGVLVCWDQWFPEGARLTALAGADILFYPTAIGWHPKEKAEFGAVQHSAWETVQRAHAIANGLFVAVPNRVGFEPGSGAGLEFWGASFVADPSGRIVSRASHDREEVVVVACDLDRIDEVRQNWPFFRDRRIDAYDGLMRRVLDKPAVVPESGV
jgi:N-carbamoylputrescine amidase